jgi:hypothetical protein
LARETHKMTLVNQSLLTRRCGRCRAQLKVESNAYIVVAIGCGAAFLDYDNDGWLDILVLMGARWEGARLSGRRGLIQTESGRIVAV